MQHPVKTSPAKIPSQESNAELLLGVDPGLQRTGFAFLSGQAGGQDGRLIEAGLIQLDRREPLHRRLLSLENDLFALIERRQPAAIACEELYAHYKHPRTAILMAHARGVILALAARCGLDVLPIAATHSKKLLTGSGRAGKLQVQRAVAATLGLPALPEPHDVSDAIAIAVAGLRLRRTQAVAARGADA